MPVSLLLKFGTSKKFIYIHFHLAAFPGIIQGTAYLSVFINPLELKSSLNFM